MTAAVAAFLVAIGCAPAPFQGPAGAFVVWVCPPVQSEAPAEPAAPPPEEREG